MSRPIAKDHDAKRDHILKTAARVFADHGFARASMTLVAKECGISKANIYHYYDGKDALLFDILDSYLCALRDRIFALPLDGRDPADKLRLVLRETLRAYDGMDHEHKIQSEVLPLLSPAQQEVLKGYQRDLVDQMSALLAEIAPEVLANNPAKLRASTMSIFGMLNWFYMWNRNADLGARDAYADLVADLALGGLPAV